MPIPDGITHPDLLSAFAELRQGTRHKFGHATKFLAIHEGMAFAPKAVVGLAARFATGRELGPRDFSSGEGPGQAVGFLRLHGIKVVPLEEAHLYATQLPGYLILADPGWLEFHITHRLNGTAPFARKPGGVIRDLPPNALVFCMENGEKPRSVHLWGNLTQQGVFSLPQAFERFGHLRHFADLKAARLEWGPFLDERDRLAVLQLSNLHLPDAPIAVERCALQVSEFAVRGQHLDACEVQRILTQANLEPAILQFPPDPDNPDNSPEAIEGRRREVIHLLIERDSSIVKKAKATRLAKDPALHCDVCGLSLRARYGPVGSGFIEAHHIVPLSNQVYPVKTRVTDFAMVCPNCHRMLHRGKMSLEDLRAALEPAELPRVRDR